MAIMPIDHIPYKAKITGDVYAAVATEKNTERSQEVSVFFMKILRHADREKSSCPRGLWFCAIKRTTLHSIPSLR